MATKIINPRSREEWLHFRKEGIGSSEVATVVGLNPYESPYQFWKRKTAQIDGTEVPREETMAMKLGHLLEGAVAQCWCDETGREIIKRSACDWLIVNGDKPFLRVSPDRTYWLRGMLKNSKNKGILECKTTQKKIDADDLPKHWFVQLQYQLGVAEMEHGSLAWLTMGRDFGYKNITLVPDFYKWLVEEVEKFWRDNILQRIEPAATTLEDVVMKYNAHTDGKVVEVDEDIFVAYQNLKEVKERLAQLKEEHDAFEEKIKFAFGDAEAISYGGEKLATWKSAKPTEKFDSKAFKAAHPDLAKEFTSIVQGSRRFLIK